MKRIGRPGTVGNANAKEKAIPRSGRRSSRSLFFKSGHHGDLWLDLELLCLRPRRLQPFIESLAARLSAYELDAVCGPLVEGAFVAMSVAGVLDVEFVYAERFDDLSRDKLFPVEYRVPSIQRAGLKNRRLGIVNDVINAGSAVRGAFADLQQIEARTPVIGSLLLGDAMSGFAAENGVELRSIAREPNNLWIPAKRPLCAAGEPLLDIAGFRSGGNAGE